ncbi:glycoside hydrolase domain-containing protein, partial [Clostridium tyrobutyricum]
STTITAEKAATLKANGYEIVGRYLTGIYAMTHDELETIFANNLKVVPIFEVGGYNLIYFTSSQGVSDANSAIAAANNLGFPDGTIIYFTVDFDALDINVTNAIIPYFKAIKNTFTELGSKYNIGIYAPRNVCSRIANAGYSCSSFVCDMSSGFSGNLGYTLPQDWAFDQIHTISLGSGSGYIEIDNDISSGKNNGWKIRDITQELKNLMIRYQYIYESDWSSASTIVKLAEFYEIVRNNGLLDLKNQGWDDKF